MTSAAALQKKSIRFRARSLVAFVLAPEAPLCGWLESLDRWTANSPGFFAGRPVVLDLALLRPDAGALKALVADLGDRGIRICAIDGGDDSYGADLPPVLAPKGNADERTSGQAALPASAQTETPASNSLVISMPIRSGQLIFHPQGDVTVLGSVGSGSEIVAGGSVHVYGTLRGRIFAGATGHPEARIFCRRNEAELLAVDGWYRTADDMEPSSRGRPVQAYLENGVIQLAPLD